MEHQTPARPKAMPKEKGQPRMLLGPTIVGSGGWRRAHACALARRWRRDRESEIEKRARQTKLTVETGTERDGHLGGAAGLVVAERLLYITELGR